MKRIFKAAAAIAAVVLALSLFAACDDDDDSSSGYTYTYTSTYDFSSYTKATAASTGWDEDSDWDIENYYTNKPDNAFLIIVTYETVDANLAVYASSDKTGGISVYSSGAGSTSALLIDSSGYTKYPGVSYTSGATSFTYYSLYASQKLSLYTLSDFSDGLYIAGNSISELAVYYY